MLNNIPAFGAVSDGITDKHQARFDELFEKWKTANASACYRLTSLSQPSLYVPSVKLVIIV